MEPASSYELGHSPESIPRHLRGYDLRATLTVLLADARRDVTVSEVVTLVEEHNGDVAGRPSKTISDALRYEVGRGRVTRVARSTYRFTGAPRSTMQDLRRRFDHPFRKDEWLRNRGRR